MGVNRARAGTTSDTGRRSGIRRSAATLLLAVSFSVASLPQALPAGAISSEAQQLLTLINQERATVGVQALTFRDDLVLIAAEHSSWMASTGNFQHRSDLSEGVTGPWTRIGENIAYGWGVSSIHQMFMASEGHCKNNLYAGFNRVGIEFATGSNGALYVTVVFVQESGGSHPPATVCPYDYTTTTTSPPATTTTTSPPATTTTTSPPATTTTTSPPATTTTTSPPATTTTTSPPATTTTTSPPATTTTTSPPVTTSSTTEGTVTTTTEAIQVVLSGSSTTTTHRAGTASDRHLSPGHDPEPVATQNVPEDAGGTAKSFPLAALAGGATVLVAAGGWWLIGAKRAATSAATSAAWQVPHGGVRPPQ